MSARSIQLRVSAVLGFLAILLGSLGAHGKVHDIVVAHGGLENWKTAVLYHLTHAILLFGLAFGALDSGKRVRAAWFFIFAGILLFCGALYLNSYTQNKMFAHGAPFGGGCLMLGWLLLFFAGWGKTPSLKN